MNKENTPINAARSKCWTCKFGLCVQETELEKIIHDNMNFLDGPPPSRQESNPFEEDMSFQDQESDDEHGEEGLIEHTIEHSRVKAICYWRPEGIQDSPPIGVAKIDKCSRYEKRS